ncbi:ASTL metalloendopeptidase, partial [Atractosteus spatula]|nr:ASTL metalloendopeptidase [Atractosteus spatula]
VPAMPFTSSHSIRFTDIAYSNQRSALICPRGPQCFWPKSSDGAVYIPYVIDPEFSVPQRVQINRALSAISTVTCIIFTPRSRERDYLNFRSLDGGCNLLQTKCFSVLQGFEDQFVKRVTNNLGTPNDYDSILHYKPGFFWLTTTDILKINRLHECKGESKSWASTQTPTTRTTGTTRRATRPVVGPTIEPNTPTGTGRSASSERLAVLRTAHFLILSYTSHLFGIETDFIIPQIHIFHYHFGVKLSGICDTRCIAVRHRISGLVDNRVNQKIGLLGAFQGAGTVFLPQ